MFHAGISQETLPLPQLHICPQVWKLEALTHLGSAGGAASLLLLHLGQRLVDALSHAALERRRLHGVRAVPVRGPVGRAVRLRVLLHAISLTYTKCKQVSLSPSGAVSSFSKHNYSRCTLQRVIGQNGNCATRSPKLPKLTPCYLLMNSLFFSERFPA